MSVTFSGTNQGKFTQPAVAANKNLTIRSGADWIRVNNYTARTNSFWQYGMPEGQGLFTDINGTTSIIPAGLGFYTLNTFYNTPGASVALTQVQGAAVPLVLTANTSNLSAGDIVRLYNVVLGVQLNSIDFTVGTVVANTSFELLYMSTIVATGVTTGTLRKIPYNPAFYPSTRTISSITNAANAVITMTVAHGYKVGQIVSFIVPSIYGMIQISGLQGSIVSVTTGTITVDIDSTAFTAFAFPTTAAAGAGFTQAQVVPVGMDTSEALNNGVDILSDATLNSSFVGVTLVAGATSPGGAANDVIYWTSGNSFSISN